MNYIKKILLYFTPDQNTLKSQLGHFALNTLITQFKQIKILTSVIICRYLTSNTYKEGKSKTRTDNTGKMQEAYNCLLIQIVIKKRNSLDSQIGSGTRT